MQKEYRRFDFADTGVAENLKKAQATSDIARGLHCKAYGISSLFHHYGGYYILICSEHIKPVQSFRQA